jgi:tetratricopeptide (TPR) repeat protein
MTQSPNKITQFWQELKRRKVIKVIAMYAGVAYILIELASNVAEPLRLPEWIPTFVILLLIIGFPITIILSWIFDVTPEGIKKTEPIEEVSEQKSASIPTKRRLQTSDVIIAVLFIVVCILLYPRVFKIDKFKNIRDEDGRISIAVMPFQNMTNDTLWDVWQMGIQNELITYLSRSEELSVRQLLTMNDLLMQTGELNAASFTPAIASDISSKLETNSFIIGSIKTSADIIRINAHLIDTYSNKTYKTFQIDGNREDDLFAMTDSLSWLIRNFLEISKLKKELDSEFNRLATTTSVEALQCYIQGVNAFSRTDYSVAADHFNSALKIDSNFSAARGILVYAYGNQGKIEEAIQVLDRAFLGIESFPYEHQLVLKYTRANFDKDPQTSIKYLEQLLEYEHQSRGFTWQIGAEHMKIGQLEKAAVYFEKAFEIDRQWGGGWIWPPFYTAPGWVYHKLENHEREWEIYEMGLRAIPDYRGIIYQQAICALSKGDSAEGTRLIEHHRSLVEDLGLGVLSQVLESEIYEEAGYLDRAEKLLRTALTLSQDSPESTYGLARFLIRNKINVEEGMNWIEQLLEGDGDNWMYLYSEGVGLYKQEKYDEAYEALQRSWKLRPNYYHEHYLLLQEAKQTSAAQ